MEQIPTEAEFDLGTIITLGDAEAYEALRGRWVVPLDDLDESVPPVTPDKDADAADARGGPTPLPRLLTDFVPASTRTTVTLEDKRRAAIAWLGERWLLHPANAIKRDPEPAIADVLARIVRQADVQPFMSIGHVLEHVVPEARQAVRS